MEKIRQTGSESAVYNGQLRDEYVKAHVNYQSVKYFKECYAIESFRVQACHTD
jgi:hypothetical protein